MKRFPKMAAVFSLIAVTALAPQSAKADGGAVVAAAAGGFILGILLGEKKHEKVYHPVKPAPQIVYTTEYNCLTGNTAYLVPVDAKTGKRIYLH